MIMKHRPAILMKEKKDEIGKCLTVMNMHYHCNLVETECISINKNFIPNQELSFGQ